MNSAKQYLRINFVKVYNLYSNVSFFQDDDSDDVLCIGTPGFGQFKRKREKKKGTTKVT